MTYRFPAALALGVGLTLTVAAPASAEYTPDGTATLAVGSQYYEGGGAGLLGYCPEGTASATLSASPSTGVGVGVDSYTADDADPVAEGRVEGSWGTDVATVAPGTIITFTMTCLDAGLATLATASQAGATYDSGATLVAPGSVVAGEPVALSGICADHADVVDFEVRVQLVATNELVHQVSGVTTPSGPWISSFDSGDLIGGVLAPAGSQLRVTALCGDFESEALYSLRTAVIDVVAAAEEPAPAADPADTLAETGIEPTYWLVAVGIGLLGIGIGFLRRRPA